MNIKLIQIGKTKQKELEHLIISYSAKLNHMVKFEMITIPDIKHTKSLNENQQKEKEAELLQKYIHSSDWVVLLDEKGKHYTSNQFADFFQQKMNSGIKTLVFIIGGPYGFSNKIYQIGKQKIALSSMTFTHEMIRLLFVEQVYRACAILNHLPYHHN